MLGVHVTRQSRLWENAATKYARHIFRAVDCKAISDPPAVDLICPGASLPKPW